MSKATVGKRKVISIFGSASPLPGSADYENARILGEELAKANFVVQTGGYSGIMEAASRGAAEAGGLVIGVTCNQIEKFRPLGPNPWVKKEMRKETLRERLLHLVEMSSASVVMPGGVGTLSELALSWSFVQVGEIAPRPILVVGGGWQRVLAAFIDPAYVHPSDASLITEVKTVHEAVKILAKKLDQ